MMLPLLVFMFIFSPFLSSVECNDSQSPLAPALFAFGDSLFENGNTVFAMYKPYGINFPARLPTGRVTNGKTFVDFIADYLRLPYPQAYLSPIPPRSRTGFTYAAAGCGILPHTGDILCRKKSMDGQIKWFNQTITNELGPNFESPAELAQYLANSIFLIWGGSNDYLLNYFLGHTQGYNSTEFADLLIEGLSHKLENLHELGARKFVVLEVGPLGCLPVYRMNGGHDEKWCDETKNKNATMFNERLHPMIKKLASTYQDSYFTIGNLYSLTTDLFYYPENYGMSNVSSSCCTTGKKNLPCLYSRNACENPNEYLFFDGAHPTQASYNILASRCFYGSDLCGPLNIQQLAQAQITTPSLHSAT